MVQQRPSSFLRKGWHRQNISYRTWLVSKAIKCHNMSVLFSFARSLETGPTSYFTHYTNLLHLPFSSCSSVSEVLNFRKARRAEATLQRAILNLASSELQSRGRTGWLTRHDLELLKINFFKNVHLAEKPKTDPNATSGTICSHRQAVTTVPPENQPEH